MKRMLTSIGLILALVIFGCGGGDDTTPTTDSPNTNNNIDDYSEVVSISDTDTTSIQYDIDIFNNAAPVTTQLGNNQIPTVVEEYGQLLILDTTTWPDDWKTGNVVMVEMLDGMVEYKRIVMRFELDDGRLAIGAEDSALLEVVSEGTLSIEGGLDTLGNKAVHTYASTQNNFLPTKKLASQSVDDLDSSNNYAALSLTNVVDYKDETTVWLINEEDLSLYDYSNENINIDLGFPGISLSASPEIILEIVIDKPSGISDIFGAAIDYATEISAATFATIENFGGDVFGEGNEIVVSNIGHESANYFLSNLKATNPVVEKLEAIHSVLNDRKRLKKVHVSLTGSIDGVMNLAATASLHNEMTNSFSSAYEQEFFPVLVPILGPIPLYLQFEVVGVTNLSFDSELVVSTGVAVNVPIQFTLDIIDGEFQPYEQVDMTPVYTFTTPNFEGSKANLEISAGVLIESGLNIAKTISTTIDPGIFVAFQADAEVTGDIDEGCVDLSWDIYGLLNVEAEAELDLIVTELTARWDFPLEYKPFKDQWPNGSNSWCWGGGEGTDLPLNSVTITTGANKILNPSFESGYNDWEPKAKPGDDLSNYTLETSRVQHGSTAARIEGQANSGSWTGWSYQILEQYIDNNPSDQYYYVSVHVDTDGISNNQGAAFMEFYQGTWGVDWALSAPWAYFGMPYANSSPSYYQAHGIFRKPSTPEMHVIGFKVGNWASPGVMYIDNAQMLPVTSTVIETIVPDTNRHAGVTFSTIDSVAVAQLNANGEYVEWIMNSPNTGGKTIHIKQERECEMTFSFNGITMTGSVLEANGDSAYSNFILSDRYMHLPFVIGGNTFRITSTDSCNFSVGRNIIVLDPGIN